MGRLQVQSTRVPVHQDPAIAGTCIHALETDPCVQVLFLHGIQSHLTPTFLPSIHFQSQPHIFNTQQFGYVLILLVCVCRAGHLVVVTLAPPGILPFRWKTNGIRPGTHL